MNYSNETLKYSPPYESSKVCEGKELLTKLYSQITVVSLYNAINWKERKLIHTLIWANINQNKENCPYKKGMIGKKLKISWYSCVVGYLLGAEGPLDRWKWTFCHFPSFLCHTRVSSLCWVAGKPSLKNNTTNQ